MPCVVYDNIESLAFADDLLDRCIGRHLGSDIEFYGAKVNVIFLREFAAASTCGAFRPVVSRMLANTQWPALARALAERAPNPLDAPVIMIILRMDAPSVSTIDIPYPLAEMAKRN